MSMTFAVWTYSGGSINRVWILTLLPLRSRFSWARFERMSFALFRASIRWSSDLSGAALEDWTWACIGAAVYPRLREAQGSSSGLGRNTSDYLMVATGISAPGSIAVLVPAAGSRELSVPTATTRVP